MNWMNKEFTVPHTVTVSIETLSDLLYMAEKAHSEYEKSVLKGVRDEDWPMYYARFILDDLHDTVPGNIMEDSHNG